MAISTENTFLMKGTGTSSVTYSKLVDIKEFPDLGGAPGIIDTTTLTNHMKVGVADLIDPGELEFNCNYDPTDYATLVALKGKKEKFAVWFGINASGQPDGHNGKFEFEGELSVWVKGGGVSAAVDMGVSIAPSTDIVKAAS